MFKKLTIALLITVGVTATSQAAPIINPFAAGLSSTSYTADATYLADTAEDVFNGTGDWNAGSSGWHWIQADMGSIQSLTQFMLMTAQSPNGFTEHQIFLSDDLIGANYASLTPIYSRSGSTIHGTLLDITLSAAQSGRFLQILVNNGPISWTALGDEAGAGDVWTQVVINDPQTGGGGNTSVPEPGALMLLALGLGGFMVRRRYKS